MSSNMLNLCGIVIGVPCGGGGDIDILRDHYVSSGVTDLSVLHWLAVHVGRDDVPVLVTRQQAIAGALSDGVSVLIAWHSAAVYGINYVAVLVAGLSVSRPLSQDYVAILVPRSAVRTHPTCATLITSRAIWALPETQYNTLCLSCTTQAGDKLISGF